MMKINVKKLAVGTLLSISLGSLYADNGWQPGPGFSNAMNGINQNTSKLSQYLLNLGQYIGPYDLTKAPSNTSTPPLINNLPGFVQDNLLRMISSIPISYTLLPKTFADNTPDWLQTLAQSSLFSTNVINGVFGGYSAPSNNDGTSMIQANQNIDMSPYQKTPTAQALLNMLSTPSACSDNDKDCKLSQVTVATYVGTGSSDPQSAISYNTITDGSQNASLIPSLNAETLMNPLMYNTGSGKDNNDQSAGASPYPKSTANTIGYLGDSQQTAAAAFVRYVTGQFSPITLPSVKDWTNASSQNPEALLEFINKLRSFVAQTSVGISNINFLMAKRMNQPGLSSQAAYEFQMASQRLQGDPNDPQNSWMAKVENLDPKAAQKEMLYLLAEMNYQLYLNRQIQERLLLSISTQQIAIMESLKSQIKLTAGTQVKATGN